MHEYEIKLLSYLKEVKSTNVEEACKEIGLKTDAILWAAENLKGLGYIKIAYDKVFDFDLNPEAKRYENGLPEQELLNRLSGEGHIPFAGINGIAISWAKKNGWIDIEGGEIRITEKGKKATKDKNYQQSIALKIMLKEAKASKNGSISLPEDRVSEIKDAIAELEHRKLVKSRERLVISKIEITDSGVNALVNEDAGKEIRRLTREIIKSGSWKGDKFKSYDVNSPVENIYPARRHPMKEFISIVRQMWVSQGFMETYGPVIESSFWNFDALFSPQDHPTRDMQDTFFLSNPELLDIAEGELLSSIAKMHRKGWKNWNEKISKQAVLRTHTTSVSAHNIRDYGSKKELDYPIKLFTIGKVFRNESIDYKHLAELHQLDGIIIGKGLGVAHLKSTLEQFYSRLGFKVKFKPSYFPFVEPGLEASYYDEEHGDWIELCGGGIIRKEITKSLGTDMRVIAWGMGLDRLMFRYLGINSLSEMYKNEIGWLRNRNPVKL